MQCRYSLRELNAIIAELDMDAMTKLIMERMRTCLNGRNPFVCHWLEFGPPTLHGLCPIIFLPFANCVFFFFLDHLFRLCVSRGNDNEYEERRRSFYIDAICNHLKRLNPQGKVTMLKFSRYPAETILGRFHPVSEELLENSYRPPTEAGMLLPNGLKPRNVPSSSKGIRRSKRAARRADTSPPK